MRKYILGAILGLFLTVKGVMAAEMEATIRLDRIKTGVSPLPILVMLTPGLVTTESWLDLTIPSGWSVGSSLSVSTTGLPTGVTPLPGVGNGTSTGSVVRFPISDLTQGVDYGFFITAGIGVNPSVGNFTWLAATDNESRSLGVPVIANDQVAVTGKVGARASDFQIGIVADKTADLGATEVVNYEVTYGSYLLGLTKPMVITASWSRGTVVGSPTPSVDVVDYVIGSGSTGYGGVSPVIDLVNRKITWTISSFPANTINEKVSFSLKVNDSYTGQSRVRFEVTGELSGANVVTTNSSVTNYYQPSIVPTSTPTSSPSTSTSTSTSTSVSATATPTAVPPALKINSIQVVSLSPSGIGVEVAANQVMSKLTIKYGLNQNNLNKTLTSVNNLRLDVINLDDLTPETPYYFRIVAETAGGKTATSEIFTFITPSISEGPVVNSGSLVVSVNNNVILDASEEMSALNSVVLVPNQKYAFRINVKKPELLERAKVLVKNTQVLGINTVYGAEPNSLTVDLSEIVRGGFVGHLVSPRQVGYYDIILRMESLGGGISETKLGVLRVIDSLTVVGVNSLPIENAEIYFYRLNPKLKIYEDVPQQALGIINPSFTEPDGRLNISLPNGKYRINVEAVGYGGTVV